MNRPMEKDTTLKDGQAVLERARRHFKTELSGCPAVQQGMPPESVRKSFDVQRIAIEVAPDSQSLREATVWAMKEMSGWSVDPDCVASALTQWLDSRLEECLEEIWTEEKSVRVRVTRTEISVEGVRGGSGPSTGRLPQ